MDDIVDYAMPTMRAERALKELHQAFLAQEIDLAKAKALEASHWSLKAWEALNESKGVAHS